MKTTVEISDPLLREARELAALCRQHGVREMWSADRDFSLFRGLPVVNPLVLRSSDIELMRQSATVLSGWIQRWRHPSTCARSIVSVRPGSEGSRDDGP